MNDEPQPSAAGLVWMDRRWHCAGQPIHAGCTMALRARHRHDFDDDGQMRTTGPGPWVTVRIESENEGRVLLAFVDHFALTFRLRVGPSHELKWP